MTQIMKAAIAVGMIVVLGGIALLARGQATTRPGEPTLARVWVENRAPSDAVPVVVEALPSPVAVRLDPQTVLRTVSNAQNWEYRTVQLSNVANAGSLAGIGNEGWEAVGVLKADAAGASILFKRPR